MKFLSILMFVAILTLTAAENCPDCKVGGTQDECSCETFKKTVTLENGTDLFCCGQKINLKKGRWPRKINNF